MGRLYTRAELREQRLPWKHIRLLEQARSLGDVLILALNSDAGVGRAKGESGPLLGQDERAEIVLALEAAGGEVVTMPLEPGYSTTNIVEEILNRP